MSIDGAMANLLAKALASGVKSAPNAPPESTSAFPFAVAYERQGDLTAAVGGVGGQGLVVATIYLDVHVSRQLLPAAIEQARSLRDPILRSIIADPSLGNELENLNGLRYQFGHMDYGGIDTIGYRFEIAAKVRLHS